MANTQIEQLLEIPIPSDLPLKDLEILRKQANSDFDSKDFLRAKAKLIEFGIPEDTPEKYFGIITENWYENFTQPPQYTEQTTTIGYDYDTKIAEAEQREKQIKETQENARREVERAQQKLREIKARNDEILRQLEKQKGKKLYVEIKSPPEEKFTKEEYLDFEKYKGYLKSVNPEEMPEAVDNLAQEIELRVGETLKKQGLDSEDIKIVTESTAVEIIDNIVRSDDPKYVPPTHSVAVADSFTTNPEEVNKITKDENTQKLIKENARFTDPEALLQGYERQVVEAAFGNKAASRFLGPKPKSLTVNFYETPQSTTTEIYTPYNAVRSAQISLENHNQNLEELKQRGLEEGKRVLVQDARSLLRQRLDLIHPQSGAGRFLQSNKGDYILRAFGVGPQDGLSLVEKVGVNYGIGITAGARTAIWAKATTQTAISIANTGGLYASEAFLGGAGTAASQASSQIVVQAGSKGFVATIATALGVATSWITAGLSLIVGTIVGWISSKINWPKVKQWFKDNGWTLALPLVLLNPWAGIGLTAAIFGLTRQIKLAAIGAGIWGFFGMLGSAFVVTIGTPIIVTLLVLPPLVAFIMFVINSGAYIVPPSPVAESGFGPGSGYYCTEVQESTGINYSVNSVIATRALGIVEDLYQGFWCFWNRSPGDYPEDKISYKPSYPELFDEAKFKAGVEPAGEWDILFWCTWLVIKSYEKAGITLSASLLNSQSMQDYFDGVLHKFVDASLVTYNKNSKTDIIPGAVIFFDVPDNEKDRTDHVAIVYSVTEDGVTYIQSNAGLKVEHLTLGPKGLQSPSNINVKGIGLP